MWCFWTTTFTANRVGLQVSRDTQWVRSSHRSGVTWISHTEADAHELGDIRFSENGVSPGFPSNMLVCGPAPLKLGWLSTLKNSARNSNIPPSPRNPSFVAFTTEKSQFLSGGPLRIFLPPVPSWPIASEQFVNPGPVQFGEIENMAGLNHCLGLPVITVLGS